MFKMPGAEPIDYLVVGHITQDLNPQGPQLGGTAAYAALTAQALGFRVGIVSSFREDTPMDAFDSIPIVNFPSDENTTFENTTTPFGRIQTIQHIAERLDFYHIPETWRKTPIIHLAPVAQEISTTMARQFSDSFLCMTPQGMMREWDSAGHVSPSEWPEADYFLRHLDAAVISVEDAQNNSNRIAEMAAATPILITTDGSNGSTLYIRGQVQHFEAPTVAEVDPTGAGDIFAATFFTTLKGTNNPFEAASFANKIAALSVTRSGLNGIPTKDEIHDSIVEAQ